MTSARSTVDESITRQVRQGDGLWQVGVEAEAVPGIPGSLSPEPRVAGGWWVPTPAQAPESWTHCCAVRGLLRGLTAYQGRWEPGLTPRRPLWASVGSSVNGNDVPSPSPDVVRAGGEGSPATLWGSRWWSHHPGLLTPTRPQIVHQNRGRKACDRPVTKTKKKKKAEGTVFTEEDFQKFQQEYFGS